MECIQSDVTFVDLQIHKYMLIVNKKLRCSVRNSLILITLNYMCCLKMIAD